MRTDFAFKKVFGSEESKDILISFLNAILDLGEEVIVDLTIINPYQPSLFEGLKETYVDVKAELNNGTTVLIEMQAYNQGGFGNRIQSNLAKAYSTQLRSGDKYVKHNRVIALTVTDFAMLHDAELKEMVITHFGFMEVSKLVLFPYNKMDMVFVELPKFNKTEHELVTMADKWIYFIKQAGAFTSIPKSLLNEETINHALKIANTAGLTPAEEDIQEKKSRWLADQEELELERQIALKKLVSMRAANAQLRAEKQAALEQVKKSEHTTKLHIAKQMLQAGSEQSLIIQVTGLSESELTGL